MTEDLEPAAFLNFCAREKRGEVSLLSLSTIQNRNGVWRVRYEEVKKPDAPEQPTTDTHD